MCQTARKIDEPTLAVKFVETSTVDAINAYPWPGSLLSSI